MGRETPIKTLIETIKNISVLEVIIEKMKKISGVFFKKPIKNI